MAIYDIYYLLGGYGLYEFILPFLLVYAIIFAVLEKTGIFSRKINKDGKDITVPNTNVNLIISLVIAFVVIANTDIVILINTYISKMALFIVILVLFLLTLGVMTGKSPEASKTHWWLVIIVLIAAIWALGPTLGFELPYAFQHYLYDSNLLILILVIAAVVGILRGSSKLAEKP